jgi:hypothetical protein
MMTIQLSNSQIDSKPQPGATLGCLSGQVAHRRFLSSSVVNTLFYSLATTPSTRFVNAKPTFE